MTNNNDLRMVAFSPDLLEKGYKLIYRNGERPEDYKVWPDGSVYTYFGKVVWLHQKNGNVHGSRGHDFDLFLTPPEMYVGVYEGGFCADVCYDLEWLENKAKKMHSAKLYRLVPVE